MISQEQLMKYDKLIKHEKKLCLVLILFAWLLFFVVVFRLYGSMGTVVQQTKPMLCMVYSLFYLGMLLLFYRTKYGKSIYTLAVIAVLLAILLAMRFTVLPFVSDDMARFIWTWMRQMRRFDGFSYLASDFSSNYNIPYLTIMIAIARLQFDRITSFFLLKYVSIAFDLAAAWFVMKLVEHFYPKRHVVALFAFFITLCVPTLLLNGSYWGQCDSIYVALGIGSMYYGLTECSRRCYLLGGMALAFKIQTVFFLPVLFFFFLTNKIRFRDCYLFVLSYLALMTPAFLTGKSLKATLMIYMNQTGEISILSEGFPNLYMLFTDGGKRVVDGIASTFGILLTALLCLTVCAYAYYYVKYLNHAAYLRLALLVLLLVPYCLPHMHDRYYLAADLVSVAFAFVFTKKWYYCPVILLASYNSYSFYLWRFYLWHYRYFAFAILLVMIFLIKDIVEETKTFYEIDSEGKGREHEV